MSEYQFRVTVEDLINGHSQVAHVNPGDYTLLTFGSCFLSNVENEGDNVRMLTIGGYNPVKPGKIEPETWRTPWSQMPRDD